MILANISPALAAGPTTLDAMARATLGALGPAATISLIVLVMLSVAAAVYWSVVLGTVVVTRLRLPTARDALKLPGARLDRGERWPSVCVVIPAHNEAGNIVRVAASLRAQDYPNLRVAFALDRCTDETEARLRGALQDDARFEIVTINECPADWAGKVHAIHECVQRAGGVSGAELLLFADADTWFDPACVRACVALLEHRGLGMLSLLSTLSSERWFELVVQPAAGMELLRQYPPLRANRTNRWRVRPFANGQFMLFTRRAYEAAGGHESARGALLEDIFLARRTHYVGGALTGVFFADGMLRCTMYDDWGQFKRGWKRIFTEAADQRAERLERFALRAVWTGIALPMFSLGAAIAGAIAWRATGDVLHAITGAAGALSLVMMLAALGTIARIGRSSVWGVVLHPIGALAVVRILYGAASDLRRGKPTKWAGREYVRGREDAAA